MLRSIYFQNARDPTSKIANIISEQSGPLDERLAAAGLKQPMSFYLEQARALFGDSAKPNYFSGCLLIERPSDFPEYLEAAFRYGDEVLNRARAAFWSLNRYGLKKILGNAVLDSAEFTASALVSMLVAEQMACTLASLLDRVPQRAGFEQFFARLVEETRLAAVPADDPTCAGAGFPTGISVV
jgi:hypothetical protein